MKKLLLIGTTLLSISSYASDKYRHSSSEYDEEKAIELAILASIGEQQKGKNASQIKQLEEFESVKQQQADALYRLKQQQEHEKILKQKQDSVINDWKSISDKLNNNISVEGFQDLVELFKTNYIEFNKFHPHIPCLEFFDIVPTIQNTLDRISNNLNEKKEVLSSERRDEINKEIRKSIKSEDLKTIKKSFYLIDALTSDTFLFAFDRALDWKTPYNYQKRFELFRDSLDSLIKNASSIKLLQDYQSELDLNWYHFLQNISKLLRDSIILDISLLPEGEPLKFIFANWLWPNIKSPELYSEESGFDPLAIAILWPILCKDGHVITDTTIVPDLLKGIVNYTTVTLQDPKIFEEEVNSILANIIDTNVRESLKNARKSLKKDASSIDLELITAQIQIYEQTAKYLQSIIAKIQPNLKKQEDSVEQINGLKQIRQELEKREPQKNENLKELVSLKEELKINKLHLEDANRSKKLESIKKFTKIIEDLTTKIRKDETEIRYQNLESLFKIANYRLSKIEKSLEKLKEVARKSAS